MRISAGLILYTKNKEMLACIPYGKAKFNHNNLDLPKGGIEPGESPKEGVVREVKEETGLDVSKWDLVDVGEFPYMEEKRLHLFICKVPNLNFVSALSCHSTFSYFGRIVPEHVGYRVIKFEDIRTSFYRKLVPILEKICQKL